ncbi:MAG: DUF427 domain-containing protein [Pseudorhodobacter sp.]|nr:DUF427 domain-containing protein [Pseudorhodobacter sp.]
MTKDITITPLPDRYRVRLGDVVLGETDAALQLVEGSHDPVIYVPRADMAMDLLQPTDRHSTCPWKGQANYYSIGDAQNVVWTYETPIPQVAAIAGHLAFYPTVTVERV